MRSWLHDSNAEDPHSAFRNSISSLHTRSIRVLTALTFRPQCALICPSHVPPSFLNGHKSKRGDSKNSSCAQLTRQEALTETSQTSGSSCNFACLLPHPYIIDRCSKRSRVNYTPSSYADSGLLRTPKVAHLASMALMWHLGWEAGHRFASHSKLWLSYRHRRQTLALCG